MSFCHKTLMHGLAGSIQPVHSLAPDSDMLSVHSLLSISQVQGFVFVASSFAKKYTF